MLFLRHVDTSWNNLQHGHGTCLPWIPCRRGASSFGINRNNLRLVHAKAGFSRQRWTKVNLQYKVQNHIVFKSSLPLFKWIAIKQSQKTMVLCVWKTLVRRKSTTYTSIETNSIVVTELIEYCFNKLHMQGWFKTPSKAFFVASWLNSVIQSCESKLHTNLSSVFNIPEIRSIWISYSKWLQFFRQIIVTETSEW